MSDDANKANILAKLKGYRTILVNAGVLVASLPATYTAIVDALNGVDLDSGNLTSLALTALTAANLILRAVTDSPVFKKSA